jgi:hypothetical protein
VNQTNGFKFGKVIKKKSIIKKKKKRAKGIKREE